MHKKIKILSVFVPVLVYLFTFTATAHAQDNSISASTVQTADKYVSYSNGKAIINQSINKSGLSKAEIEKVKSSVEQFNKNNLGNLKEQTVTIPSNGKVKGLALYSNNCTPTVSSSYQWYGTRLKFNSCAIENMADMYKDVANKITVIAGVCAIGGKKTTLCAQVTAAVAGVLNYYQYSLEKADKACKYNGAYLNILGLYSWKTPLNFFTPKFVTVSKIC